MEEEKLPHYQSRIYHHMAHWEKIAALGDSIFLPENHYVATPGDPIRYCYMVMEGRVMTLEATAEGEEHIFNIFEQGSLFLESNLLAGYESAIYFQTMEPSELVRITVAQLRAGMIQDPDIMDAVCTTLASKYYSAMDQLRETYSHDAPWKITNMLRLFSQSNGKPYGDGWIMIDMKISQQFISNMLGMNYVTVSRAIKKLKEDGDIFVVRNGYYCIRGDEVQ